jgi:hypothetical protein
MFFLVLYLNALLASDNFRWFRNRTGNKYLQITIYMEVAVWASLFLNSGCRVRLSPLGTLTTSVRNVPQPDDN